MILQNDDFFDLWSAHEAPTDWAFCPFQLASNTGWHELAQSSSATSWVAVKRSALMMLITVGQLVMVSHYAPHLQGSHLHGKTSSTTTTALSIREQFTGQMRCWCCKVCPPVYNPFWTRVRKLLKFAFCLTSFP